MKIQRSTFRSLTVGTVFCLGFGWAAGAFAQEPPCKRDIAKFCSQVKSGGGRIARCLGQYTDQLSATCKQHITGAAEVDQACEDDVHKLCPKVKPGGGRVVACLKENQAKVSASCKAKL